MIGTNDLDKIVALTLCSGHINGEKPLSILILSDRPESGKTEIVKKFCDTPYVEYCTDVSGFGLMRDLSTRITKGEVKHIVIPELLKPLMKGKTASDNFTSTLQTVMEDGIMGQHTGFLKSRTSVKSEDIKTVGIIGCMPRKAFTTDIKKRWNMTGFMSRWLVISYKYNDDTVTHILESIRSGEYLTDPIHPLNFDGESYKVIIPLDIGIKCEKLGLNITEEARKAGALYGFREIKHIRTLVAANVVYNRVVNGVSDLVATMEDFNEIERLGYLFNEQFNAVKK